MRNDYEKLYIWLILDGSLYKNYTILHAFAGSQRNNHGKEKDGPWPAVASTRVQIENACQKKATKHKQTTGGKTHEVSQKEANAEGIHVNIHQLLWYVFYPSTLQS